MSCLSIKQFMKNLCCITLGDTESSEEPNIEKENQKPSEKKNNKCGKGKKKAKEYKEQIEMINVVEIQGNIQKVRIGDKIFEVVNDFLK